MTEDGYWVITHCGNFDTKFAGEIASIDRGWILLSAVLRQCHAGVQEK